MQTNHCTQKHKIMKYIEQKTANFSNPKNFHKGTGKLLKINHYSKPAVKTQT